MDNMHCLFFKIDTTSSSLYKDLSLILKELGLNNIDDIGLSSVKPSNVDFVFVHHNSIDQDIPKKPIANNTAILILNPDVEENFSTIQDLGYSDVLYTDWLDKRHLKNCIQKHLEFSNNKLQEFSNTISLLQYNRMIGEWEYDVSSKKISWSKNVFKMFNSPEHIAENMIWQMAVTANDRKLIFNTLFKNPYSSIQSFEFHALVGKGRNRHFKAIAKIIFKDNLPFKISGILEDITPERESRKYLLEVLNERKEILDTIHVGVLRLNNNEEIVQYNTALITMLGLNNGLYGQSMQELAQNGAYASVVFNTVKKKLAKKRTLIGQVYDRQKNRWYEYTIIHSTTNSYVYFRDISEVKFQEFQFKKIQYLQRYVIQSARNCIWVVDRKYNLILSNPAFHDHVRNFYKVVESGEDQSGLLSQMTRKNRWQWLIMYRKAFQGEQINFQYCEMDKLSQRIRYYEISLNPIIQEDSDQIIGVSGFSTEITEKMEKVKALETQYRKLNEIKWTQAHIVRAPLANILGIIHILRNQKLNEEVTQFIHYMDTESKKLDMLVRKICEISETKEEIHDYYTLR